MRPSQEQRHALDLARPTCLAAGAGSGKTGVLIERYLLALADVGFDVDAVLAVTFTRKATAEVLARVRAGVSERIASDPANAPAWRRVRDRLPDAWIMTIDAFCHRLLSTMGPAAGLPARRAILTGGGLAEVLDDAIRHVVDGIADAPGDPDRESLRVLLRALGRDDLVTHLKMLIERRARVRPWARMMLARFAGDPAPLLEAVARIDGHPAPPPNQADREQHALLVALARTFERLFDRYRELLAAANACDFRQLLEDVETAFRSDATRHAWARRFRHVLVDELQDTDPLQWEVLKQLFGDDRIERPGLFVVGDEKQAIFSFRDGDVATFRRATDEIRDAGRGLSVELADNYRSTPELVTFFNTLSSALFSGKHFDFEARHSPMRSARAERPEELVPSRLELIVGRGPDASIAREHELHALAARIRRFVDDDETRVFAHDGTGRRVRRRAKLGDQAILLRTRRILDRLEATLTEHGIPFRVLGGVGFFEQHEVRALRNLMSFLADDHDDRALLGTLRSALFAIPDSVLLAAVVRPGQPRSRTLWEKIHALGAAVQSGELTLPTLSDAPVLADALRRLERYRRLADRLGGNELLALAVRESDFLLTLDVVDPSGRSGANVEKLLDLVRRHQREGAATFDEIERSISLSLQASDDPEAQADPPASAHDAVSILTVHAAKGLEWPIVLVPGCDSDPGRQGEDPAPVRIRSGGDVPLLHAIRANDAPEKRKTVIDEALKTWGKRERIAEAKRLLYVAVTRARDHLVLTAAVPDDKKPDRQPKLKDTWLDWVRGSGAPIVRTDHASPVNPTPRRPHPILAAGCPTVSPPAEPAARHGVRLVIPATALWTIESCPRRFFIEHVLGVETAWPGAAAGAGSTPKVAPQVRGSIVHAALEGIATGVDPVSRVSGIAAQAGVLDARIVSELENHVRKAVASVRAWPVGRRFLEAPPGRVRSEVPFDLSRGSCRVVGSIDLLFEPEGGGAVILDFKTDGDVPKTVEGARKLAEARGYADQLAAYAAVAHVRFGNPVSAWLFFTESGLAVPVVGEGGAPSAETCLARIDRLLERAAASAAAGFPLTEVAGACRECPHLTAATCPGAG